jgi:D-glycero-alpha-D-manno-heptose 1-phosphate guanylyltransferase
MHAIILAGGLGTRLRSVVPDVPKPMALIQDKPFLAYLLDYLATQGMTRITLSIGYLGEKIQHYFRSSYADMAIDYVVEDIPLGTGGAIVNALHHLNVEQPLFVINGDTFVELDYQRMFDLHSKNDRLTMGLCYMPDCSRYGRVTVSDGLITAFEEKGRSVPGLINAGVYLIHPDLFKSFTLPDQFSFEKDFLCHYLAAIKPSMFPIAGNFIDIGIPDDYMRMQALIHNLNSRIVDLHPIL